jgi:hypothetical protein
VSPSGAERNFTHDTDRPKLNRKPISLGISSEMQIFAAKTALQGASKMLPAYQLQIVSKIPEGKIHG